MVPDVISMVMTPIVPLIAIRNAVRSVIRPISRLPLLTAAALARTHAGPIWSITRPPLFAAATLTGPRIVTRSKLLAAATLARTGIVTGSKWPVVITGASRPIVSAGSKLFAASTLARSRWTRHITGPQLLAATAGAGARNVRQVARTRSKPTRMIMQKLPRCAALNSAAATPGPHRWARHSSAAASS
jgi:hypothetical protein